METTKITRMLKIALTAIFAIFLMSPVTAQAVDSVATASVSEDDKFYEMISYVVMGVGIIGVVWIAYYLSSRTSPNER